MAGENYNASRLAGNVAIWLVMLAAPAGVCEWLLRRYRPRLRFSLRTMLVAMGLAAGLCGWFAAARNRANVQDPIADALSAQGGSVWAERWGPKWLDALGADHLRRHIVGAEISFNGDEEWDRESQRLLAELKRLPDLRFLSLEADRLNSRICDALGELRQLQTLRIKVGVLTRSSGDALGRALRGLRQLRVLSLAQGAYGIEDDDVGLPRECLSQIGDLQQLEHLRLVDWTMASQDLALLSGLGNLESLTLDSISETPHSDPPLLSRLPALPRLESLDLQSSSIFDRDLEYIAVQPHLKSLSLAYTEVMGEGLIELAALGQLEELALNGDAETLAGFKALPRLKYLKMLHMEQELLQSPDVLKYRLPYISDHEIDECWREFKALRTVKPDLVIDGEIDALEWPDGRMTPQCDTIPASYIDMAVEQALEDWKKKQAGR